MAYVRAVRKAAWGQLASAGTDAIDRAVGSLLDRGERASVFACSSRIELEHIAVAISATRANRQPFDYLEISDADLEVSGIALFTNEGRTPLAEVNELHRELDLADGRAERLVRVLAARNASVQRIRTDELHEVAALLLQKQRMSLRPGHWLRR